VADSIGEVWRRALDLNVRYYEAWGRVANEYVRDLGATLKSYSPNVRLPTITLPNVTTATGTTSKQRAVDSTPQPASRPIVLLEAAPGSLAEGAVLVENHLAHPVSAGIRAVVDSDIDIVILVEPDHVDLAPGESAVLRVSTTLPQSDSSAVTEIRGELLAPELVGTAVPLLIRSRADADTSPASAG
jgi:hypothetical protein